MRRRLCSTLALAALLTAACDRTGIEVVPSRESTARIDADQDELRQRASEGQGG